MGAASAPITKKAKTHMSMLLFVGLILLNLVISWWNAKVCGTYWSESKKLGGFVRVMMWCGVIQSAIGFSMALVVIEVLGASHLGYLSPKAAEAAFSLWYLAVIIPCIGTGLIITVHSWVVAWRTRSWGDAGVAAWNTFASGSNIYNAANGGVSTALDKVGDLFKGNDNKQAQLVIALVLLSLVGGVLITMWLVGVYDKRARLDLRGQAMPA